MQCFSGMQFSWVSPNLKRAHFIDKVTFGSSTLLEVNQTNALVPILELNCFGVSLGSLSGVSSIYSCLSGSHTTVFNVLFSF